VPLRGARRGHGQAVPLRGAGARRSGHGAAVPFLPWGMAAGRWGHGGTVPVRGARRGARRHRARTWGTAVGARRRRARTLMPMATVPRV
ncbi:hypothetical protein EYB53_007250, partial [Candidatus Chloroploca sp. M-50]